LFFALPETIINGTFLALRHHPPHPAKGFYYLHNSSSFISSLVKYITEREFKPAEYRRLFDSVIILYTPIYPQFL
jgi:hypothetical protein